AARPATALQPAQRASERKASTRSAIAVPASIEAPPLPKDTPAPSARITSREVREAKEAPSVQDSACE
ncbi:MAG: hypothetical protein QXJ59_01210, partial [Thermofilaceae archaeon]